MIKNMENPDSPIVSVSALKSVREQMMDAIMSLPQSSHFKAEHIERFIRCYENDARALWHVKRLGGIGGSEIGALVSALRGETDSFGTTPADLIREKLMIFAPRKTILAMRKGITAEACIRQFFLEDYKCKQDTETLALFDSKDLKSPREWMRYSPDDVVFINGRRYLVDYKHPNEATLHDEINMRYVCQLHQGKILLDYNGVNIDGMLLVQYPLTGNDLLVSEVAYDDSVVEDILASGDMAWSAVLSGSAPSYDAKNELPHALSEKDIESLNDLSANFSRSKVLVDALSADMKETQAKIVALISSRDLESGSKVPLVGCQASVSKAFNAEVAAAAIGDRAYKDGMIQEYSLSMMTDYLKSQNIDMTQFESGSKVFNDVKIEEMTTELGMTVEQFTSSKIRITMKCTDEYKESAQIVAMDVREKFPIAEKAVASRAKKPKLN